MSIKMFTASTAIACALSPIAASAASVGDVFIDSVVGVWTATTGTTATGLGTNTISWGQPVTNAGQSRYTFDGAAPPQQGPFSENEVFTLGTFTHDNFPIFAPSITGATLEVTTMGSVDGSPFSIGSTFEFDHFETPNDGNPCAAGGSTPCPDLVTPTLNVGASDSLTIDGVNYFIAVSGFDIGDSFLTLEGQSNTAKLTGSFTADVAPIPLPAAGWMLIAGAGALVAAGRKRRAA